MCPFLYSCFHTFINQSIHSLLHSFIHAFNHFSLFHFMYVDFMSGHVVSFHFVLCCCISFNLSSFIHSFVHIHECFVHCSFFFCVLSPLIIVYMCLCHLFCCYMFLLYSRVYAVVYFFCAQAAHFKSESLRCLPQSAGRLPETYDSGLSVLDS